ncbi:MAG: reverse gyrase [Candidatus Omnitrophota bacterium]|nr:MAG: reverse gyrase [Candidatus Omnitrophota bacterium]
MGIEVRYVDLCKVCGKDLTDEEIELSFCKRARKPLSFEPLDSLLDEFKDFFEKSVGYPPRGIQVLWARRLLRKESFTAVAPTGIGKTTFGIIASIFLAKKGKKSYLIMPTSLLVQQARQLIEKFCIKVGIDCSFNSTDGAVNIGYYHGGVKGEEKELFIQLVSEEKFHILITTTQFLSKNFATLLKGKSFEFIFVDDVDAILKASKNVERILNLLGFEETEDGWKGEAKGTLMVSTATAKKGKKALLFKNLLGFDIGSAFYTARNITDIAIKSKDLNTIKKILRLMGKGGIIYTPSTEEAQEVYESLKGEFKIGIVTAKTKKDYESFKDGKLDYLVGTAYYYGTLVRGLDLPLRIRFCIFFGAPVLKVNIGDLSKVSVNLIKILAFVLREEEEIKPFLPFINNIERKKGKLEGLIKAIQRILSRKEKIHLKDIVLRENEIIFPDIRSYIQGSGRTSRLFPSGLTKGASFLLEGDEEILEAFIKKAQFYEINFCSMEDVDWDKLKEEMERTRDLQSIQERKELIEPLLFVVESPTKAKQIARFFGSPSIKVIDGGVIVYEVPTAEHVLFITATLGHITDLISDEGFHGIEVVGEKRFIPIYSSIKRCKDCSYQFTNRRQNCPKCGSDKIDDAKSRIEALRKLAKDCGNVVIGTDPDSEGEKIAWDIKNLLSGLAKIWRAEFHEVTKKAIKDALSNLREISESLVKAQVLRRIEDRWIGFSLTEKLWERFNDFNLSAGRAQTPVLGWIIERALENKERKKIAILKEYDLILENVEKEDIELEIELLESIEEKRTPLPPYTTDVLLRDANFILKFSTVETMRLAQDLFERGLITYHRTDSTRVSDVGLDVARQYLKEEFKPREWAQEGAHECIRPTRPLDTHTLQRYIHETILQVEGLNYRHFALYDLIFRRFMASQASPYTVKLHRYRIKYDGKEIKEERIVSASGKPLELYKWMVWIKQPLPEGKRKVTVEIREIPKASLYTQSDIIQLMKERKIGRPSTYSTILEKLFLREYIKEKKNRVYPTYRGRMIYYYLLKNYLTFVSEERTKNLEMKMDAVESGKADFLNILRELYQEVKNIH